MDVPAHTPRRWIAFLLAGAAALIGVSAWLLLTGRPREGGVAVAGAGALLFVAPLVARRGSPLERFVDSVIDRAFDGLVLASIAWVSRAGDPPAAAAAVVAMGAGFIAAYVGARARALGYDVATSPVYRGIHYGLVAAGLLTGRLAATLWIAAALGALTAVVRASQVAKEERA